MGFSEPWKWKVSPKPSAVHRSVGFKWDFWSHFSAKVAHMALLDTPWFVTVISVLNEGVNGHLLLLSEVAIVAWTLQCGRARMGLTREERIGLIRDLLHDTKMYS